MRLAAANAALASASQKARDTVASVVEAGGTIGDGLKVAGRHRKTHDGWVKNDREYAMRIRAALLANKSGTLGPSMKFVHFRRAYFDRQTAYHHFQMIEAVENAEPDSLTLILAFPEAAKTSVLTDYVCYKLGPVDPNFRIAVISEGQDLSRKIVNHVSMRMTDEAQFAAYIDAYGPFRAPDRIQRKPWNADFLTVVASSHDEKEPSLEARGWGSTFYGGRYDLVYIDDIQSDKNLGETPRILRYLRQTALTRPAKGVGKTIMVGSRVGVGDIYEVVQDEGMVDNLVTIPALTRHIPRDEHFTKVGGKIVVNPECPAESMWPEYWSLEDLAKRRDKVGEEIWARTYMQRQVFVGAATFTDAMLAKARDERRGIGRNGLGLDVIASVDPAFDTGICAFMVCAYSADHLWVLDAVELHDVTRYEDIFSEIARLSIAYRPSVWVVEENNFQKGLPQDDRFLALARKFNFDGVAHRTNRNKYDPVMGVAMMASSFSDGELTVPWADDDARGKMMPLLDELRAWRPKRSGRDLRQDLVMTLWFAWIRWQDLRESLGDPAPPTRRPSWLGQLPHRVPA